MKYECRKQETKINEMLWKFVFIVLETNTHTDFNTNNVNVLFIRIYFCLQIFSPQKRCIGKYQVSRGFSTWSSVVLLFYFFPFLFLIFFCCTAKYHLASLFILILFVSFYFGDDKQNYVYFKTFSIVLVSFYC